MKKVYICLAGLTLLSGCATITRGSNDVLVVNSNPTGAQVQLSSGETCDSTPCSFKLSRKSEVNVLVHKDKCKPQTVRVTNKIADSGAAGMAGNVFVGGLIGVAVDAGSGATRDLVPNPVNVDLQCRR